MQLIRQKIWFVYVNSYQSACDNPEINPAASLRLFLITLLCCLSSAADSWKEEAFSIRNSSPSELQFLPHALLLCVCKLFGNLSNFTLVRFPCKRQHFRKKPSGWVNVISNCVSVCVSVGDHSMQISEVSKIRGRLEFSNHLFTNTFGNTDGDAQKACPCRCLHSCKEMRWSAVCCCSWSQTSADIICCVCFMMMIVLSFCLFLSLSNLCVVVGAGADRPRDGI